MRSLLNGSAIGDHVNCGGGASVSGLDPYTVLLWMKCDILSTGARTLFVKGAASLTRRASAHIISTSGDVRCLVDRASVDAIYDSVTGVIVTTKPQCLAITFNSANAAGTLLHLYIGDLITPLTEVAYAATADGSGAYGSDAGVALIWGNGSGLGAAFQGKLFVGAVLNRDLDLAALRDWQRRPRVLPGITKAHYRFGLHGTGLLFDESGNGNHGTFTGALPSPVNLPLAGFRPR